MTAILEHPTERTATRAPFIATLPIAGKEGEGTMATRMLRTRAVGNAAAKNRVDRERAGAVRLHTDARWRDAGLLDFSPTTSSFRRRR